MGEAARPDTSCEQAVKVDHDRLLLAPMEVIQLGNANLHVGLEVPGALPIETPHACIVACDLSDLGALETGFKGAALHDVNPSHLAGKSQGPRPRLAHSTPSGDSCCNPMSREAPPLCDVATHRHA